MEDHPTKSEERRTTAPSRALRKQRQKIQAAVAARGKQLDDLEVRLAQEMTRLTAEARQAVVSEDSPDRSAALLEVLEPHAEQLARLRDELKLLQDSFAATQQQVVQQQQSLAGQLSRQASDLQRRHEELEAAEARLRDAQRQADQAQSLGQLNGQQLAGEQERLAQLERDLSTQRHKVTEQAHRTATQRRKIAQELKTLRTAQLKEFEQRRLELEAWESRQQTQSDAAQAEMRTAQEKVRRQQAECEGRAAEIEAQRAQLEEQRRRYQQQHDELSSQRSALETQSAEQQSRREELEQQRQQLERDERRASEDALRTQTQRRRLAKEFKSQRERQRQDQQRESEEAARAQAAQRAQLDAALAETRAELDQVRRQQSDLTRRGEELAASEARVQEEHRRQVQIKADVEAQSLRLDEDRRRLAEQQAQLESERQQLIEREARTRNQRQLMARELRAQRALRRQELERLKTERLAAANHTTGAEAALSEARVQHERLRQQLDEQRELAQAHARERDATASAAQRAQHELDEFRHRCTLLERELAEAANTGQALSALRNELEESRARAAELEHAAAVAAEQQADQRRTDGQVQSAERKLQVEQYQAELLHHRAELEAAQTLLAEEHQRSTEAQAALAERQKELRELEARCQSLCEELAQAQELASRPVAAPGADRELAERLQSVEERYKMAIDDLKAERARVAELERKVSQNGRPAAAASGGSGLDWEAQKRELLRRLSEDFDEEDAEQKAEKLKIEDVVRTTDRVLAEKEQELEDLRRVLEEQSHNWGSMAVGAAAVADILDKEEIIRQERDNLQRLQNEVQQKLRQAEIDISLERAKLARERMEVDERSRDLQSQPKHEEAASTGTPAEKAKAAKASRWLKHLGLTDKG